MNPTFRRTTRTAAAFVLATIATAAFAQTPKIDADAGKALHDKDCVACHARQFGGDASKMYTRADHKVRTPAQLRAQVAWCNTQLGAKYFPEDEENVAAYLDREYYHFKR
jgi:mono/diheme cytochrome c family protein